MGQRFMYECKGGGSKTENIGGDTPEEAFGRFRLQCNRTGRVTVRGPLRSIREATHTFELETGKLLGSVRTGAPGRRR
jgi:hypothetical protein